MLTSRFCTYICTNKRNGTLYTGHTDNILARAEQHLNGAFKGFSQKYGCKYIVWFEEHVSRDEAFKRERRIKEWRRAWKLALIEEANPHWIDVVAAPVWPLPDPAVFPEVYARCLGFALSR
jgi:putative endonuclease